MRPEARVGALAVLAVAAIGLEPRVVRAQPTLTDPQIIEPGTSPGEFGHRVHLCPSGQTAVIGAPGLSGGGGAVVLRRSSGVWAVLVRLTTPVGATAFGSSVACISDGLVAVADDARDASGAVHLFAEAMGWTESDGRVRVAAGEGFGRAMAADETKLVVGAPGIATIVIYEVVRARLVDVAEVPGFVVDFGRALAVSPTRIVVGGQGAAVAVERLPVGEWTSSTIASSPSPTFGSAVAMAGDVVWIGDPGAASPGGLARGGTVLAFTAGGGGWSAGVPLGSPEVADGDFGAAIAARGDVLAVGAPHAANPGTGASVFVYDYAGDLGDSRDSERIDGFGLSVSVGGGSLLVGAPGAVGGGQVLAYGICNPSCPEPGDGGVPDLDAGGPAPDGSVPGVDAGEAAESVPRRVSLDCGCRAAGTSSAAPIVSLVTLLAMLGLRRRAR